MEGQHIGSRPVRVTTTSETAFTPLPDQLFQQANPARIDAYHQAVARELAAAAAD